ncbi:hypothetical protein V2J09_021850 [Rumex salicifolius]
MFEHSIQTLAPKHARATREFPEILTVAGEGGDAGIRDLTTTAQLHAGEIRAVKADGEESVVVDTNRSAVASERNFRDGVEAGKDRRDVGDQLRLRVEREAVAALSLHRQPPLADQRTPLPVASGKALENQSQALVRQIRAVDSASTSPLPSPAVLDRAFIRGGVLWVDLEEERKERVLERRVSSGKRPWAEADWPIQNRC